MGKKNTRGNDESRICWETLEAWLLRQIEEKLQELLEAEVTELLGRGKSERQAQVLGAVAGYRNGYGKARKLTLSSGTISIRRPRVRGLEERFESRILPLCKRRSEQVNDLLPQLYLHGLALGDLDAALGGLLGEDAAISANTVARLKEKWQGEYQAWQARRLEDLEVTYLWVDGVYVKAGLEKEKAAVLVAVAGLSDGSKVVVGLQAGHRESIESWSSFLRDLRDRGVKRAPRLIIGDGHLGIWGALRNVWPESAEQGCWNHKMLNALDRIPKKHQRGARLLLRQIPHAATREEAERLKGRYQQWCQKKGFNEAAAVLDRHWERMLTFYSFPKEHWSHIYTSNPVESPFAALRLRTDAAKRFKRVDNATAVIWKMLLVIEKKFQKLRDSQLMMDVYKGLQYANGVAIKRNTEEEAA